jgi:hypothetical protein
VGIEEGEEVGGDEGKECNISLFSPCLVAVLFCTGSRPNFGLVFASRPNYLAQSSAVCC